MEKLPLFINFPVSESVLQAFPALEESGAFYFHQLKLDADLFALMIDARPCVAIFSIPDEHARQEVCDLLENFRRMREALGYPKRDPTLRTILVAEERAISLERWHDLGVHEFIIAPILSRALAFKISRHHQRAAASAVPEPYEAEEDVVVIHGSGAPPLEDKPYSVGTEKREIALPELTDSSRRERVFIAEKSEEPSKYLVLTSMPELNPDEGSWEVELNDADPSASAREPLWNWSWRAQPPGGARRPNWSFRGERPVFDPKRGAWRFVAADPELSVKRDPSLSQRLIGSIDTPRGREIVVHTGEAQRDHSDRPTEHGLDVLEVKQTLPIHAGLAGPDIQSPGSPSSQGYRNRTGESGFAHSSDKKNAAPFPQEPQSQGSSSARDSSATDPLGSRPGSSWTHHVSQSQRSLERTLMTEREQVRDPKTGAVRPNPDDQSGEEDLPPGLQEISRLLGGESEEKTQRRSSVPIPGPAPTSDKKTDNQADTPGPSSLPGGPLGRKVLSEDTSAGSRQSRNPESTGSPSAAETNPYVDGRDSSASTPSAGSGGLGKALEGSAQARSTSSPFTAGSSGSRKGSEPTLREGVVGQTPGGKLATSGDGGASSRGDLTMKSSSDPDRSRDLELKQSSETKTEDPMKVMNPDKDPNTWSLQNLDEVGSGSLRKKAQDKAAGAEEETPEPDTTSGEPELFGTGEKPSLERISAELKAQLGPDAERIAEAIPDWLKEMPELAGKDPAWYARFWKRILALLRRMRQE